MLNTASLFKIKNQKELEERMRMEIRIMQMLHERLEGMDLISQLAAKMEAGETPSVPFLTYQEGRRYSSGEPNMDIFEEKELVLERFRDWVDDSPYRKRNFTGYFDQNSLNSIAYLFDTTFGEMDFPELPLFFKHGSSDYASMPARKIFALHKGPMFILRHLLGKGLDISLSYEPIDEKTCRMTKWESDDDSEITQSIGVNKVIWSVVFTGRNHPRCAPLDSYAAYALSKDTLIGRAYEQLKKVEPKIEGLAFTWPKLLTPFWMRPLFTPAMVSYCEEGNDMTAEMMAYESDAREKAELQDPGEATGETTPCAYEQCGGVLGKGGFCRTCSKKPAGILSFCPMEGTPHNITHYYAGEDNIYAGINCDFCHYMSRWSLCKGLH
jgi:hypothetical protein